MAEKKRNTMDYYKKNPEAYERKRNMKLSDARQIANARDIMNAAARSVQWALKAKWATET